MPDDSSVVVLTGEQRAGEYLVWVYATEVWLTAALFRVLCELVAARFAEEAAGRKLDPKCIERLRRALNESTGRDIGQSLIRPTGKSHYVLAVSAHAIRVDPSFRTVLLTNCLDKDLADALLARCIQK